MIKALPKSFKARLLFFFILLGTIPLSLSLTLSAINMISEAKEDVENEGALRNRLASEKISALYDKNLHMLRSLAQSPIIHQYLLASESKIARDEELSKIAEKIIFDTNNILGDQNNMIVTNTTGQQLVRTDGYPLVNVLQRWYFWESIAGREAISEVVTSLASGRLISVVEVPVIDSNGKVIGLVQRDYELNELQAFVESLATDNARVLILERNGRVLANSRRAIKSKRDRTDMSGYAFVQKALAGESGNMQTIIDLEDSLVTFSRNEATGWAIATIQPGSYVREKVYSGVATACASGFILLILIGLAAYRLSDIIARPIVALNEAVRNVANHDQKLESHSDEDELTQMASAVEQIKISTNALKEESETDQLTHLLNKVTMEKICREKLRSMDIENPMALFIIDLDHFKEANDTYGHQYGDRILKEFALKLKMSFKSTDFVGRFGGDEFVVLIPKLSNHEFVTQKARHVLNLTRELKIDDRSANITASIGISVAPPDGIDYETLFNSADKSLYQVKRKGRDGFCLDRTNVFRN